MKRQKKGQKASTILDDILHCVAQPESALNHRDKSVWSNLSPVLGHRSSAEALLLVQGEISWYFQHPWGQWLLILVLIRRRFEFGSSPEMQYFVFAGLFCLVFHFSHSGRYYFQTRGQKLHEAVKSFLEQIYRFLLWLHCSYFLASSFWSLRLSKSILENEEIH